MTEGILDAGGILPGDVLPARDDVDLLTARRYAHPVLGPEHPIVRLVPAGLGAAEDLAMEFLGCAVETQTPVGVGVRQALGFPAWALVNDPANGRHALAMVKEMERLARVAKSKPGNARDGYEVLARPLGQAAPHTHELAKEGVVRPDGAFEEVVEVILAQFEDRQKPPVEYVGEPGEQLVGLPGG